MGAIAFLDNIGVGTSVELATQDGSRCTATGIAGVGGVGSTVASASNSGGTGIGATATVLATVGPLTLKATDQVDIAAMLTATNISEGLGQASTNTLQVFADGVGLLQPMQDAFAVGEASDAITWIAYGLTFAAGAHTFTLVGTATAGSGNVQADTGQAVLSVRVFSPS